MLSGSTIYTQFILKRRRVLTAEGYAGNAVLTTVNTAIMTWDGKGSEN
jgi:hypothetical protein